MLMRWLTIVLVGVGLLAACAQAESTPTSVLTPRPTLAAATAATTTVGSTPTPTLTSSATPTITPIPSLMLTPSPAHAAEPEPESLPPQREDSGELDERSTPHVEIPKIVEWSNTGNGWEPSATPPACPDPLIFVTPTDLRLVTSVLYPGQYRGDDYKPHGGFRYDNSRGNEITIIAPMDAQVVDGGRYLADGEIQYMFDLISPCGIWYRVGHLRELTSRFVAIAETFPEAVEGDSRTYGLNVVARVTSGETIATAVGLIEDNNIFMDWGVYDLRSKNIASEDVEWAALHPGNQEQYGVCWFDFLSLADEKIVRNLPPADGVSGAMSDYCL